MSHRIPFKTPVVVLRKSLKMLPRLYNAVAHLYHWCWFFYEAAAILVTHRDVRIVSKLYSRFGAKQFPDMKSQYGQERFLVSSGLIPKRGGTFVDIGCNDPEYLSNTHYLEKHLAYRGIAADPIGDIREWQKERPNTVFMKAFVSDKVGQIEFCEVHGKERWSSMLSGAKEDVDLSGKDVETSTFEVPTVSLGSIIRDLRSRFSVDFPDVLSIDVEGHELNVLSSFDWSEGQPRVVVLENFGSTERQKSLRNFMYSKGYRWVARIWVSDDIYVYGTA
jgi:FkbM family methyltransferase